MKSNKIEYSNKTINKKVKLIINLTIFIVQQMQKGVKPEIIVVCDVSLILRAQTFLFALESY